MSVVSCSLKQGAKTCTILSVVKELRDEVKQPRAGRAGIGGRDATHSCTTRPAVGVRDFHRDCSSRSLIRTQAGSVFRSSTVSRVITLKWSKRFCGICARTSKSHPSSCTFRFAVTPTSSQNARVAYCRGGRVHSPFSIVLPVPNCFFSKPYTVQTMSTQPLRRQRQRERRFARSVKKHPVGHSSLLSLSMLTSGCTCRHFATA